MAKSGDWQFLRLRRLQRQQRCARRIGHERRAIHLDQLSRVAPYLDLQWPHV